MTTGRVQSDNPAIAKSRQSAPDRVYEWLRNGILSSDLVDGSFLDEWWVAQEVGTSRTPVREAFHRLSAERFIDLLPRKGAQVRPVTARELQEVLATRYLIEGHAAAALCSARRGAPPEMTQLLGEMEAAEELRDWPRTVALNRDFHRAMVVAHGNLILLELYDALRSRQLRVGLRELQHRPERATTINSEHKAIVAALKASDGALIQKLLESHLRVIPEIVTRLAP